MFGYGQIIEEIEGVAYTELPYMVRMSLFIQGPIPRTCLSSSISRQQAVMFICDTVSE